MLLDRIIPSYQFAEHHAATIPARIPVTGPAGSQRRRRTRRKPVHPPTDGNLTVRKPLGTPV